MLDLHADGNYDRGCETRAIACNPISREERMLTRRLLQIFTAGFAFFLFPQTQQIAAQNVPPAALTGQVTSEAEGAMEGVVVSAKKAGSTVTVSVISDAQGHYRFPANRLGAGKYSIKIRAAGYDPAAPPPPRSPPPPPPT